MAQVKEEMDKAETEAKGLREKAENLLTEAKDRYYTVLDEYRKACRIAKVPCEYEGTRRGNVSDAIHFTVEKVEGGVKVAVNGRAYTGR